MSRAFRSPTMRRATAERLFARLDGDPGAARRVVVPTTLVERGSGELRP
jgi:LacI family transcriptional regulator